MKKFIPATILIFKNKKRWLLFGGAALFLAASAYLFLPIRGDFLPSPQLFAQVSDGAHYLPASTASSVCSGNSCIFCDPDHQDCSWFPGTIGQTLCSSDADCAPPPPPPPSADIKANGSDGPITIGYNTSATISWASTNASSCSVSPTGWTGTSNPGISTGNLTSSQTYTLSCSGPGGTAQDSVTVNIHTLTGDFTVSPNPVDFGQSTQLTASVTGGTAAGTINYSFWWNCTSASNSVSEVSAACGALPSDTPGDNTCSVNANGAKCDGETATSKSILRAYSLNSTAKVILERGGANPWEGRRLVEVRPGGSCSVSPTSGIPGDPFTWTANATGGGNGSYTYGPWNGSPDPNPLDGRTGQSVQVTYTAPGNYSGEVTITSAGLSRTIACSNTVTIVESGKAPPKFKEVPPQ